MSEGDTERSKYHKPRKPNTCETCGAHVVVLQGGECIACSPGPATPRDELVENDWSAERFPDEAREVDTDTDGNEGDS